MVPKQENAEHAFFKQGNAEHGGFVRVIYARVHK